MASKRVVLFAAGTLAALWLGPSCSSSPNRPGLLPDYDGGGGTYHRPDGSSGGSAEASAGAGGVEASSGAGGFDASTGGSAEASAGAGGFDASTGGSAEASAGAGGVEASSDGSAGTSGAGGGVTDGGSDADAAPDAHCSDGIQDFDETDVDCGGALCPQCAPSQKCLVNSDCASLHCDAMLHVCDAPTCSDGIKNQDETDVDCGGSVCQPCNNGWLCVQNSDCQSGVCASSPLRCQAPTCNDGVKNGYETDVDCGGNCPECKHGQHCSYAGDCVTSVCSNGVCGCPSDMVNVPLGNGGSFCVDRYEVTYDQYTAFYNSNPPVSSQIAQCAWNTNYVPSGHWPPSSTDGPYPVRDVNWCDAYAYCRASGKRLCGKIGGGPGSFAGVSDASESQWFDACSAQGSFVYPYGNTFDITKCNGSGYQGGGPDGGPLLEPLPGTRSPNNCLGGEPTLYDMSGNLAEWTDECDGTSGPSDNCRVRGGAYDNVQADLTCAAEASQPRDASLDTVGFRCCLD